MTAAQRRVDVGEAEADQVHGTPGDLGVKPRLVKLNTLHLAISPTLQVIMLKEW